VLVCGVARFIINVSLAIDAVCS